MAIITSQVKLTPLATGSLPSGTEGAIAYDSTTDELKQYDMQNLFHQIENQ